MTTTLAKPKSNQMTVKDHLNSEEFRYKLMDVIPRHLTPEKLVKTALLTISKNPALGKCSLTSLMSAVMAAGELGLNFSGNLGGGYLVPYGAEAQFIPGYRGLIDLARRSGEIASIYAELVYENDQFERKLGTSPSVYHVPAIKNRGVVIGAYAVARFKDKDYEPQIEFMDVGQLDKIRSISKAKNASAWTNHTEEMYRKTVIRRLAKYLPLSPDLAKAFKHLDNTQGPDSFSQTVSDVSRADALVERLTPVAVDEPEETGPEVVPHEPKVPDETQTTPDEPAEWEKVLAVYCEKHGVDAVFAESHLNSKCANLYAGKKFHELDTKQVKNLMTYVKKGDLAPPDQK